MDAARAQQEPAQSGAESASLIWAKRLCFIVPFWYLILGFAKDRADPRYDYFVTEYMPTYTAGFVRRGLPGQLLLTLSDFLHCPPLEILKIFRFGLSTVFLAAFGYAVYRNSKTLGALGVVLLLLSPMFSAQVVPLVGQVDLLFILSCGANAALASRLEDNRYIWWVGVFFWIFGSLICLTHEGYLVLGLPLNVLISARKIGWRNWPRILAIYIGPLIAGAAAMKFSGTMDQRLAIQNQWLGRGVVVGNDSPMGYFSHTIGDEIRFVFSEYVKPMTVATVLASFLATTASFVAFLIWMRVDGGSKRKLLWAYFGLPMLLTLPLYVIGFDWNRWLLIPIGSGLLALLYSDKDAGRLQFHPNNVRVKWLVAMIFVGVCTMPLAPYSRRVNGVLGVVPASLLSVKNLVLHRPASQ